MTPQKLIEWIYKNPDEIGRRVGFRDLTALHGKWMRTMIYGTEDYTLMAHRAAYKSSCLAVSISLYMVLFPTTNIIFIRKADNDVAEMMRMVQKILESQVLRDIAFTLYGRELVITENGADKISTSLWTSPMGSPQLQGLGLGSSITGKHCELLITDDICGPKDRYSRAERERTKNAWMEMQNICNRGGRIISLGTKWHKEDVFTLMPNIHVYDCYHTGLITPEKLKELRSQMTAALFAANYELKIIASEDALFREAGYADDCDCILGGTAHIDAAYGGDDYTAYTILRKDGEGGFYGYGKIWHRHVDKCLEEIAALHEQYQAGSVYCEKNGDKGYLAKELRSRGFIVNSYQEHANKFVKIATYLRKYWNRIRWIDDTDPDYISMILDYTEEAEHDDAPDSAASLIRALETKTEAVTDNFFMGGF